MTIKDIYELGIRLGIEHDPRGREGVKKYLGRMKRGFDDLKPSDKPYFDEERLTNPYPDSGLLTGDTAKKVRRVMAGIDIGVGEVLLADRLSERGEGVDLIISHHPLGKCLAALDEVMDLQIDVHKSFGVPIHLAEKIMEERRKEVGRGLHPFNHYQVVDLARILGVSLMNMHTVTDNMVDHLMRGLIAKRRPETIAELMELLGEIPEY